MENRLRTYGNIMVSTPVDTFTVKDVRDFLRVLDLLNVPDSTVLHDGFLVYEYQTEDVQVISCGNHKSDEGDVLAFLVPTHYCEPNENS